jgi:hypothetical protein
MMILSQRFLLPASPSLLLPASRTFPSRALPFALWNGLQSAGKEILPLLAMAGALPAAASVDEVVMMPTQGQPGHA